MPDYSFADVQRLCGPSRSNLTWWTNQELIRADVKEATGTGQHRRFSFLNLVESAVAVELHRYGVTVDGMRVALSTVRLLALNGKAEGNSEVKWRESFRAEIAKHPIGAREVASRLGMTSPREIEDALLAWRMTADSGYRRRLAFGGLLISLFARTCGFRVQQNDQTPSIPWGNLGRSALAVNLIPILDHLESATGESL